ncbi:MAG: hypothetical protein JNM30_01640 [Rhodospirillales bacterium]|nr:hypothetical protein [Rhodospirillales bacterium]
MASLLARGMLAMAIVAMGAAIASPGAAAQATPATVKPATKPATKAPAAKASAPAAKKAPAKATPPKATPVKATAGPAKPAAAKPAAKAAPPRSVEKKIGEVVSVDYPDVAEIRLDGPWREHGYPLRLWMTSYVRKDNGERRHLLSVQVTHHEEAARNYVRATLASPPEIALTQTARPSLQCTRNRDGTRQCFHTEAYALDLSEDMLTRARAAGTTITLAADPAATFEVPLDAATIDAQLKACEAVTPVAVAAAKKQ